MGETYLDKQKRDIRKSIDNYLDALNPSKEFRVEYIKDGIREKISILEDVVYEHGYDNGQGYDYE